MGFGAIHKSQLKHLIAVIAYLLVIVGLYLLLHSTDPVQPHVTSYMFEPQTNTFTIAGKNLRADMHLTAIPCNDMCSNVIAREFMWEMANDVKIKDSIAWVLYKNIGLVAVDVSTPKTPRIVNTVHINKHLWHLKIKGEKAYIACSKDGVVICDISTPEQARIIAAHKTEHLITDISPGEHLLYVGNGRNGFSIMDPVSGKILRHIDLPGSTLRIAVIQDKLLVFSKDTHNGELFIYSLQDPANPVLAKQIKLPGTPRDYLFKDNMLYLANGRGGVTVLEMSPQTYATVKSTISTPFRSNRLAWFKGKLVVFGRRGRIGLYTWGNDGSITLESSIATGNSIFGATIFDHYAIIACNYDGIAIVDLSVPPAAQKNLPITNITTTLESANWQISSAGIGVRDGNKLYYLKYMADGTLMHTCTVTFPSAEFFRGYTLTESMLYAPIKNSGLHVLKIRPDGILHESGIFDIPLADSFSITASTIHGNRLYLCCTSGLVVFNISNPEHPVHLPNEYIKGNMRSIVFARGYAYIASFGEGIKICRMDAKNNLGPAKTIAFPEHLVSGGKSLKITYADGFLFAACGYRGVLSIDVRNPEQPMVLDSIELQKYCKSVQAHNGILCAEALGTLYLIDIRDPEHMVMLGKLKNMRDFHLNKHGIMQLHDEGITQIPRPLLFSQLKTSRKRITYHLPAKAAPGRYGLFLNQGKHLCQKIGSMVFTPNQPPAHGWEFISN